MFVVTTSRCAVIFPLRTGPADPYTLASLQATFPNRALPPSRESVRGTHQAEGKVPYTTRHDIIVSRPKQYDWRLALKNNIPENNIFSTYSIDRHVLCCLTPGVFCLPKVRHVGRHHC